MNFMLNRAARTAVCASVSVGVCWVGAHESIGSLLAGLVWLFWATLVCHDCLCEPPASWCTTPQILCGTDMVCVGSGRGGSVPRSGVEP